MINRISAYQLITESRMYAKIFEWSEQDHCFVGSCPGLFYGGCHGQDEKRVFAELCDLVEETITLYKKDGKPLPSPTSGMDYANKMLSVV
jgi:predicted RNase H-like HicB family nuclease